MSDVSVADVDTFVLVKELLSRSISDINKEVSKDEDGPLFSLHSIPSENNKRQLVGLVSNVVITWESVQKPTAGTQVPPIPTPSSEEE